ncbi:acyltransferase family protein [Streptomyces avidinii]|uniref:Peptidoglycan/LPS O-acetylase OafA/YrhL n=1 Tax=Streptomyces avidinii TaxID=1895 RepID=A0ABS4L4B8_STRAV|nr:acyltransferase [Streptomyces avidinii]MBP2036944.1 peptidoglycan/LPS O-acetylase OafA/YrhL [Streptomyces avidinii]GGY94081.1 acyltransferase [Streptomyces avidinii]
MISRGSAGESQACSPGRPLAGAAPGGRLAVLDGVRVLAALGVLFYHYFALPSAWDEPPESIFPTAHRFAVYGWLGVEIFFMVSGFVICMSAWGRTVGDFAVSRVSRLFPAYWAAVVFTSLVLFASPEIRQLKAFSDVVVNLSMLQGGIGVPNVDDAYWTLFVELKFYVLFALVVMRGVTYRNCVLFCAAWTLAGVVAPTSDSGVLSFFAAPASSPYFIAGIGFYLMRRFRPNAVLWAVVGVQFLLAQHHVHARMISSLGREATRQTPAWPAHVIIVLGFALMAALALGALDGVQWRWLPHAGAITYPLYLIHMMAGLTLIHRFRRDVAPVPLVLGVTATMLLLAWLIHRLVERPLGRLLRDRLRRGVQDIRSATPRGAGADRPPAPAPAPDAQHVPAGRQGASLH